jgi:hypothetical protein
VRLLRLDPSAHAPIILGACYVMSSIDRCYSALGRGNSVKAHLLRRMSLFLAQSAIAAVD